MVARYGACLIAQTLHELMLKALRRNTLERPNGGKERRCITLDIKERLTELFKEKGADVHLEVPRADLNDLKKYYVEPISNPKPPSL